MNAKNGKKEVYGKVARLLSSQEAEIISDLISKGVRPETAKKVVAEIWRELFHKHIRS